MSRPHYSIVDIRSGLEIASTRFEGKAATAMDPGTVYGMGATKEEARERALEKRKWHLEQSK